MLTELKSLLECFFQHAWDVLVISASLVLSVLALVALLAVLRKRDRLEIDLLGHRIIVVRRESGERQEQQAKDETPHTEE